MSYENRPTKAERREKQKNKRRSHTESGRSTKLLQSIIIEKSRRAAKKIKEKHRRYGDTDDNDNG